MFTSQLYRVLKSPTLWLGSLVYVAAMLYMGISSCFAEYNMGFAASGFAWLDVLVAGTSYMSSFLTAFLPPLLCVLSGAGLVRQDVDCGLYKYAVMRAGHMKYLWAKLGAAVTGAVIFCLVSYGATLAIAYIAFPGYAAMPDFVMIWNRAFRTFGNYLAFHDYALLPVYTAASSTVACMSFAVLGIAAASLLRNKYLIYASGLICFMLRNALAAFIPGIHPCTYSFYLNALPLEVPLMRMVAGNILMAALGAAVYFAVNITGRERMV